AADGAPAGSSSFSVQATGIYTSHAAQAQLTVVDTTAPSVALGPLPQMFSGMVRVDALAADNTGVVRTEIWLFSCQPVCGDGSLAVAAASLIWDTTTAGDGAHALEARAYDAAGNFGTTGRVAVTVQNSAATRDFTIGVTPASQAVQVAATAQDNTEVAAAEVLLDGAVVASTAMFDWDTTASPDGPHILEAHAYDAAGNLGSSGSVQVVVQNNAATRSFAASISPPAASFPDTGSASFTVSTQTLAGAPQPL